MAEHHIIYLPGLGDPHAAEQSVLDKLWKIYKVKVHYHPIYWRDSVPFAEKLDGIIEQIDELKAQNHIVSLVGTSAGASAAINAFARRADKISGVVCVCGKLRDLKAINQGYYTKYPTFKGSIELLEASLSSLNKANRAKILTIRPFFDEVVPVKDTYIDGATTKTIPSIGHVISIMLAITLGSYTITKFLKSQTLIS